jgi:tight adherence protein B
MIPLIALVTGAAVLLLIWGGRGWLLQKFESDTQWVRQSSLRFNPNPINARAVTATLYAVFISILVGLIWINPIFGPLLWLVLLMIPKLLIEMLWRRRKEQIDKQLAPTISAMCNSIRAGLTLVQAVQRLAEQAPEPIRTEFQVMANRYAYGADLESTIREAKSRLNLPNFNLFASALLLNREMGGDVAQTLARISLSLDRLRQMRQTVEAHTSEGRTNIKVLLVAPVAMLLMISTVDWESVKGLFTTSIGYCILLTAGVLTGTGVYFASKITRSEV